MAFFDTLSKKLSDAGQSVSQQTKNLGEINRLNNLIAENRKGISQRCFELGKAYYQAHHEEENVEFPALVSQISELLKGIEEAEETIKQLKGITKCPTCGTEVPAQSAFCPNCGTQIAAVAAKPRCCPGCGKEAPEGSSFCVYCGTKHNG